MNSSQDFTNRFADKLGFDPLRVVRVALIRGLVQVSMVSVSGEDLYRQKRREQVRDCMRRARGTDVNGMTRQYVRRPELRGLSKKDYDHQHARIRYQERKAVAA